MVRVLPLIACVALVSVCVALPTSNTTIPRACVPPHDTYPFCDPKKAMSDRIDDLISRLTLEEKPLLLIGRESPKGNISRLGIPEYDWGGNCIHGVQSRCGPNGRCPTTFPNPNNLGASFNRSIWFGMGSVIGTELRALWLQNVGENHPSGLPHIGLDCWSPNVGIQRDPRWGRNLETPGEDPYICGQFGVEYSKGMQNGVDKRFLQGVATLKHFDANSLEGPWFPDGKYGGKLNRHTVDANISQYDLQSTYLPAFKASVMDGGAAGVMCSYNSINGVPSCASSFLLTQTLREAWKFDGYVTSDSGAVKDIYENHHYTSNWTETVTKAIDAGCDVESAPWPPHHPYGTGGPYLEYLPQAVQEGILKESSIDAALRNAVGLRFRLGLFDPIEDQPYWHVKPDVVASEPHTTLAKESTAQGFVLLKNDNDLLPLSAGKKVAIIGPHAMDNSVLLGNYLGQICPDGTYDCIEKFSDAINSTVIAHGGHATVALGCKVQGIDKSGFDDAVAAAKAADHVIFIGGLDGSIEGEGHDRPDVALPSIQSQLIGKVKAVNPNIVVVLMHGGMVGVDEINTPGLVSIGYPGRYAPEALAQTIFGLNFKAWGKLTTTWYHNDIVDKLNMVDFSMATAPGRTYRYYQGEAAFEFGHGLSYTKFNISSTTTKVTITKDTVKSVDIVVKNVGKVPGDEVVMALMSPESGTIPSSEPASKIKQQLIDFNRVGDVMPGESQTTSFTLSYDSFTLHSADGSPTVFPGKYMMNFSGANIVVTVESS